MTDDEKGKNSKEEKEEKMTMVENVEEEVELVKLGAEEGAIIFRKEGMDLIVPNGDREEGESEFLDEIINTITFMLYALEREDWKGEFITMVEAQTQKEEEEDRQAEIKRRRSHLKVVK